MHYPKHQNVERASAKLPLGAVYREYPRLWDIQQCHNNLGNRDALKVVISEKPL
jgi:hypothetical protein